MPISTTRLRRREFELPQEFLHQADDRACRYDEPQQVSDESASMARPWEQGVPGRAFGRD
jgi:hypothetical protein